MIVWLFSVRIPYSGIYFTSVTLSCLHQFDALSFFFVSTCPVKCGSCLNQRLFNFFSLFTKFQVET